MILKLFRFKFKVFEKISSILQHICLWIGGPNPNLADLAVFGVLRPIRYLQSGKDMVEHTSIGEWYTRMEKAVGESARIGS